MKQIIKLLTAIFLLSVLASCSEDKEDTEATGIAREWSLSLFSSGLAGNTVYQKGDIIWQFDSKNELTVKINIDLAGERWPVLTEGQYPFELKSDRIVLEGIEYDYTIVNNALTISNNPELDGPELIFTSMK